MKSIHFNDVLKYITCPLSLTFDRQNKIRTRKNLFAKASREAILTYFNTLSKDKGRDRAVALATRKFTEIWASYIATLPLTLDTIDYGMSFPINKIQTIYNPQQDVVIGTNFPIEIALNGDFILKDTVDVLLLNTRQTSKTFTGVFISDEYSIKNKRYLGYRATMFRAGIQRYLNETKTKRKCELKVVSLTEKEITIVKPDNLYYDIKKIVYSAYTGIKNKVIYPTVNHLACKECMYKEICTMKIV